MAESEFSWLKIASFFGALSLVVLSFIVIAAGINMSVSGNSFYGVSSILGGLVCGINAVLIYLNYQKKSRKQTSKHREL